MLISPEYCAQNAKLHADRPDYGSYGHRWMPFVWGLIADNSFKSMLDYGCGKATLLAALTQVQALEDVQLRGYDPAVPTFAAWPEPADLVVCTDVLEHVEPECIDAVIVDLREQTVRMLFTIVSLRPSSKSLPDGRNAHLLVRPVWWWLGKLWMKFELQRFELNGDELAAIWVPPSIVAGVS